MLPSQSDHGATQRGIKCKQEWENRHLVHRLDKPEQRVHRFSQLGHKNTGGFVRKLELEEIPELLRKAIMIYMMRAIYSRYTHRTLRHGAEYRRNLGTLLFCKEGACLASGQPSSTLSKMLVL